MTTDKKMVFILLSFLAFAHCTDLGLTASGDDENRVEPDGQQSVVGTGDHLESHEPNTTAAAAAVGRTGRQYYQPSAAGFAYQPFPQFPQRRAYKGPHPKKRPPRNKPGRRPRPRRRPAGPPPPPPPPPPQMLMSRYRRPALRAQHTNYIDSPPLDYDDGFESSVSFDYGDREFDHEPAAAYVQYSPNMSPMAVVQSPQPSVRSRKRPSLAVADETQATIVHVPVRVQTRPVATVAPTTAAAVAVTADPMEKLRQMVQEAMDEHFASRHQELYADGFGKQHSGQVYSAKYKRQQTAAADKDKQQLLQRSAAAEDDDAAVPLAPSTPPSRPAKKGDVSYPSARTPSDVDADGSDNRPLTLAEISAYMGSKPAETVLSAGGHRYVLSDALQQTYRQQQQQQHQQQYDVEGGSLHRGQQYLRYVSPFETIYELPAARWTYK